jgi:hypothetical protein
MFTLKLTLRKHNKFKLLTLQQTNLKNHNNLESKTCRQVGIDTNRQSSISIANFVIIK